MVETKLTKKQYKVIRSSLKENNCRLYPNYEAVRAAKELCYPPRSSITITESSADIKLQDLLDHTCKHILLTQRDIMKSLNMETTVIKADLICKWGCDESSGQSEYKQKFFDESTSDANIFLTSLVPLQLQFVESEMNVIKKLILFGKIFRDLHLLASVSLSDYSSSTKIRNLLLMKWNLSSSRLRR